MKRHALLVVFGSLLLTAPLVSSGEDAPEAGPGTGACHADVQRLCSQAKGTPGGVGRCLREHREELSPGCREQIDQARGAARGRRAEVEKACKDELDRFCAEVAPARGRMRCLRQHEAELSDACRGALPEPGMGRGPR